MSHYIRIEIVWHQEIEISVRDRRQHPGAQARAADSEQHHAGEAAKPVGRQDAQRFQIGGGLRQLQQWRATLAMLRRQLPEQWLTVLQHALQIGHGQPGCADLLRQASRMVVCEG